MIYSFKIIRLPILLLCVLVLASCTQMRSEFYRNETQYLYELGCTHYKQGEYKPAQKVLEELITLDPDYGPAYAVLGNLAMIDEQYELAYDRYQLAIDHDPELEKDILPFLMVSTMHKARKPLLDSGVDLGMIYPLMLADKFDEIETLLADDVPLELLVKDSVSVTPGQLHEMRVKAVKLVSEAQISVNFQLFLAYLLYYGDGNESIIEELLSTMIQVAHGSEKQETSVLMGRLQEKQGNYIAAAKWYLAAVQAGATIEDVAHHLAKIYQVDLETILPPKNEVHPETDISVVDDAALPASPVSGPEERAALSIDDETEFTFPKPQAVLITSPR